MATKLIVLTGFVIAFAAGLVTGLQHKPLPAATTENGRPLRSASTTQARQWRPPSFWVEQLTLSQPQLEKWNQIWSDVANRGGRGQEDRRRQLRQEMEKSILALIPEADRSTYTKVQADFTDQ